MYRSVKETGDERVQFIITKTYKDLSDILLYSNCSLILIIILSQWRSQGGG
jgi:hypothetical protein